VECRYALRELTESADDAAPGAAAAALANFAVLNPLAPLRETGKTVQNALGRVIDQLESVKNALNWTHPWKTRHIFNLLVQITFAAALLPARYIMLVVGVTEFTFKFWPAWYKELRTPAVDKLANMVGSLPSDRTLRATYRGANDRFLAEERSSARYARTMYSRTCAKLQACWVGKVRMKSPSSKAWVGAFLVLRCNRLLWWRTEEQALAGLSSESELHIKHTHAGIGGPSPMLLRELGAAGAKSAVCIFGLTQEGLPMKCDFLMESPDDKADLEAFIAKLVTLRAE